MKEQEQKKLVVVVDKSVMENPENLMSTRRTIQENPNCKLDVYRTPDWDQEMLETVCDHPGEVEVKNATVAY